MDLIYTKNQIDLISANSGELIAKREELGFVNTDCNIVRNLISAIMKFTIKEENIFSDERINNLNNLYNSLTYGR